jgi:hypothetical protein
MVAGLKVVVDVYINVDVVEERANDVKKLPFLIPFLPFATVTALHAQLWFAFRRQ